MVLTIQKQDKGLYFESDTAKGWLKDALFLPDLIHNLKPSKVIVLDPLKSKANQG